MANPTDPNKPKGTFEQIKEGMGEKLGQAGDFIVKKLNRDGLGKTVVAIGLIAVAILGLAWGIPMLSAKIGAPTIYALYAITAIVGFAGIVGLLSSNKKKQLSQTLIKVLKVAVPLALAAVCFATPAFFMSAALKTVTVSNFFMTMTGPVGLLMLNPAITASYLFGLIFLWGPGLVGTAYSLYLAGKGIKELKGPLRKPLVFHKTPVRPNRT